MIHTLGYIEHVLYVQLGSRYILSLANQRSWFEVRRLQHHQQIKNGQHMVNKTWLERERK